MDYKEVIKQHLISIGFNSTLSGFKILVEMVFYVKLDYNNIDTIYKYEGIHNVRYLIKDWSQRSLDEGLLSVSKSNVIILDKYPDGLPTNIKQLVAKIATYLRDR